MSDLRSYGLLECIRTVETYLSVWVCFNVDWVSNFCYETKFTSVIKWRIRFFSKSDNVKRELQDTLCKTEVSNKWINKRMTYRGTGKGLEWGFESDFTSKVFLSLHWTKQVFIYR